MKLKIIYATILLLGITIFIPFSAVVRAAVDKTLLQSRLKALQNAYPDHVKNVHLEYIEWWDGTRMAIGDLTPSHLCGSKPATLADQLLQAQYIPGEQFEAPTTDPGRVRCDEFFCKMYGDSAAAVQEKLVVVDWMPEIFGYGAYQLRVSSVNDIAEKVRKISAELTELVYQDPTVLPFVTPPLGGSFKWRVVAGTQGLSAHSFGIAIDICVSQSHYWRWELEKAGVPVTEWSEDLQYHNTIPYSIIEIFEKYGFASGSKWRHFDTMHFEFRPEMFFKDK